VQPAVSEPYLTSDRCHTVPSCTTTRRPTTAALLSRRVPEQQE